MASRTSCLEAGSGLGAARGLDVRRVKGRDTASRSTCSARRCDGGVGTARSASADCGCHSEARSEEHTSELQSQSNLVCRLLLEKKKQHTYRSSPYSAHDHTRSEHDDDAAHGDSRRLLLSFQAPFRSKALPLALLLLCRQLRDTV